MRSGPGETLYDPDRPSEPDPVISSIVTDHAIVLAGIDVITIQGSNFSSDPTKNFVYFEDGEGGVEKGGVLEASPTQLRVKTPNFPGDPLRLRVSVMGAENYSPPVEISLRPAVVEYGEIVQSEAEEVTAMTRDASGDLIAALQRGGDAQGIFLLDEASGERSRVAESARPWTDLVLGSDGTLYGVLSNRAVYSIPSTGLGTVFAAIPTTETPPAFSVLTQGPDGELWAAGAEPATQTQTRFYRFETDASYRAFTPEAAGAPFAGVVRDMVVYNGALYVASETGTTSRVWRFPIQADGSLAAGEITFPVPRGSATAIAFAADGTLFVGTSNVVDPVYTVAPGGSGEILYPGVIPGPVRAFAWGSSTSLYYSTPIVPPATATGASTPAQLYQLETRRQGAP